MIKQDVKCIICQSSDLSLHFWPPNRFNGKEYSYYKCSTCHSISISPIPTADDLNLIYGLEDHSYFINHSEEEAWKFNFDNKEFTHHKYELDFLEDALGIIKGKKILDYACGSGFYLAKTIELGLTGMGIEYDSKFASFLRKKTKLDIFSLDELKSNFSDIKFDVVHLGHVLEHLPDPRKIFEDLKPFVHQDTYFIIDGPLENNICLSRMLIDLFSRLKKRAFNEYVPQHLSFTNYDSQLLFFKDIGLKTVKYKAVEQFWPLPERINSFLDFPKYILALSSIYLSNLFTKQGNIFHYMGKYDKN